MEIRCAWEHNGDDTLLYAVDYPGAYTRGASLCEAKAKMPDEIRRYMRWMDRETVDEAVPVVIQEKPSDLAICDADSDVLFDTEVPPLDFKEYCMLKQRALLSAEDFLKLYTSIPDVHASALVERTTFYGSLPRTAEEMLQHTRSVNTYYFGEIGVDADCEGSLLECRLRGFDQLEHQNGYLENRIFDGSYGESWTLRKMLRRFIWHDRIHAKAMFRMAKRTFPDCTFEDPFFFGS